MTNGHSDDDLYPWRRMKRVTATELDESVKQGCGNPNCTDPSHDPNHQCMGIAPVCHPKASVRLLYDSLTQELFCACEVCKSGFLKVGIR
jgi:hypothetical protein